MNELLARGSSTAFECTKRRQDKGVGRWQSVSRFLRVEIPLLAPLYKDTVQRVGTAPTKATSVPTGLRYLNSELCLYMVYTGEWSVETLYRGERVIIQGDDSNVIGFSLNFTFNLAWINIQRFFRFLSRKSALCIVLVKLKT